MGLHYDEAANLVLTREIVAGDYRPLFIRAYTGKEVLFFYASAPWVWMTGGSEWGLRLGGAMVGVLTVAATFAATRALLGRRRGGPAIALFAAGWMAVAFPHVLLSRYGFRAISQPLLQALTVAALWRGLRSRRVGWTVAGGVFLGLTGYTYLAARLFPLPLALTGGWLLARSKPPERRRTLRRFVLVLGVAAIVFAPLGFYFLRHPDAFTTRIAQVAAPSFAEALRGIGLCLRALVRPGAGDPYIRFNAPGQAVMDPVSALLALVGVGAMLLARRTSRLETAGRILVLPAICRDAPAERVGYGRDHAEQPADGRPVPVPGYTSRLGAACRAVHCRSHSARVGGSAPASHPAGGSGPWAPIRGRRAHGLDLCQVGRLRCALSRRGWGDGAGG